MSILVILTGSTPRSPNETGEPTRKLAFLITYQQTQNETKSQESSLSASAFQACPNVLQSICADLAGACAHGLPYIESGELLTENGC
jgi:hypothetical protein